MTKLFYFRCTSNPKGPLLKLTAWEAREMQNHPDYERVDEFGEVVETVDDMEGTIPFQGSQGRK
jgi:hypothetical protein